MKILNLYWTFRQKINMKQHSSLTVYRNGDVSVYISSVQITIPWTILVYLTQSQHRLKHFKHT